MAAKRERPLSLEKEEKQADNMKKRLGIEVKGSNEEEIFASSAWGGEGKADKVKVRGALKWGKGLGNFSEKDIKYQNKLGRQYFRQEVVELSKSLLGKMLIRETAEGIMKAIIVQTQAYKAPLDKACHAYNNKKTQKTKYFWLDGGHLYIYTIYMPTNICLNVVAGLEGQPQAVLIRAVQPLVGLEIMRNLRKIKSSKLQDMCNGPGKVGQSLAVEKDTMNGIDLTQGQFRIVDAGITGFEVDSSRRVNIDYAQEWIDKPWRFYIRGNTYVSKANFQPQKHPK